MRIWCNIEFKVMDCELIMVCYSKEFNFGDFKKVYWVYNLEEIVFFIFYSFECKERKSNIGYLVLKRLKIKVCVLKNLDICDDFL